MRCQHCHSGDAISRDGITVTCHLFGDISGAFCPECLLLLQQPYEAILRQSIREQAPQLSDQDLARMPDQMLKFTLCLPIPPGQPAVPDRRSASPSPVSP